MGSTVSSRDAAYRKLLLHIETGDECGSRNDSEGEKSVMMIFSSTSKDCIMHRQCRKYATQVMSISGLTFTVATACNAKTIMVAVTNKLSKSLYAESGCSPETHAGLHDSHPHGSDHQVDHPTHQVEQSLLPHHQ